MKDYNYYYYILIIIIFIIIILLHTKITRVALKIVKNKTAYAS